MVCGTETIRHDRLAWPGWQKRRQNVSVGEQGKNGETIQTKSVSLAMPSGLEYAQVDSKIVLSLLTGKALQQDKAVKFHMEGFQMNTCS